MFYTPCSGDMQRLGQNDCAEVNMCCPCELRGFQRSRAIRLSNATSPCDLESGKPSATWFDQIDFEKTAFELTRSCL